MAGLRHHYFESISFKLSPLLRSCPIGVDSSPNQSNCHICHRALKLHPEKLPFGIFMNSTVNIAFALFVGFCSTFLNVFILAKQSMHVVLTGMLKTFLPMFLAGYIIPSICLKQYNKFWAKISF